MPESRWIDVLAASPDWKPDAGPLIVVSPHPDDEVLAAGGLIHAWTAAGRAVTIVSVTDGEAAYPGWHGLDLLRRDELRDALRKLSVTHISVVRVGIPDGRVSEHMNKLRNALVTLIDPSSTLIAPYERDGHPDHEATGTVCMNLARAHGLAIARYPVWTWHHTEPESLVGARWGKFALSLEARRAKGRAVRCFASQLQPPDVAPIVPPHVLTHFERSFEAFLL